MVVNMYNYKKIIGQETVQLQLSPRIIVLIKNVLLFSKHPVKVLHQNTKKLLRRGKLTN